MALIILSFLDRVTVGWIYFQLRIWFRIDFQVSLVHVDRNYPNSKTVDGLFRIRLRLDRFLFLVLNLVSGLIQIESLGFGRIDFRKKIFNFSKIWL